MTNLMTFGIHGVKKPLGVSWLADGRAGEPAFVFPQGGKRLRAHVRAGREILLGRSAYQVAIL